MVTIKTLRRTCLMLGLVGSGLVCAAAPNDGALDTTWGFFSTGKQIIPGDFGGDDFDSDEAKASVIGPDGSMYIALTVQDGNGKDRIGVTKLLPNGSIDIEDFGTQGNGIGLVLPGNADSVATSIVRDPQGRLLVGGYKRQSETDFDFIVCRFNSAGSPIVFSGTTTTCVTASFTSPGGISRDIANDMALQADGKIVLAGTTAVMSTTDTYAAFARFNANGTSDDVGFGGNGKVAFRNDNLFENMNINAVAIASNGKIVGVGTATLDGETDGYGVVARVTSAGVMDPIGGPSQQYAFTVTNSPDTVLNDLVLVASPNSADDDIVGVGYTKLGQNATKGLIAKVKSNGVLDTGNFSDGDSTNGYAQFELGDGVEFKSVALQPGTGFVVASTYFPTGDPSDLLVLRYLYNGDLDPTLNKQIDFGLMGLTEFASSVNVTDKAVYVAGTGFNLLSNKDPIATKLVLDRIFADGFED